MVFRQSVLLVLYGTTSVLSPLVYTLFAALTPKIKKGSVGMHTIAWNWNLKQGKEHHFHTFSRLEFTAFASDRFIK